MFAAIATSLIFALFDAQPLVPVSKWSVSHEDQYCVASRAYLKGDDRLSVAIRPVTWGDVGDVMIIRLGTKMRDDYRLGRGSVTLPTGERIDGRLRSWTSADRAARITAIEVPRDKLAAIESARELTVAGDRMTLRVAQAGSVALAKAVDTCEAKLVATMESTPVQTDATPAGNVPAGSLAPQEAVGARGNPARWITVADYPADAVRLRLQGTTAARWRIEPDGRVKDCFIVQRSDHPALDEVVCAALRSRARYLPAQDADGKPVAQIAMRRVFWRLP